MCPFSPFRNLPFPLSFNPIYQPHLLFFPPLTPTCPTFCTCPSARDSCFSFPPLLPISALPFPDTKCKGFLFLLPFFRYFLPFPDAQYKGFLFLLPSPSSHKRPTFPGYQVQRFLVSPSLLPIFPTFSGCSVQRILVSPSLPFFPYSLPFPDAQCRGVLFFQSGSRWLMSYFPELM